MADHPDDTHKPTIEVLADHQTEPYERLFGYGRSLRQLVSVSSRAVGEGARYVAYSSDVGEAFRPIVPRWAVNATYGVAIAYILGDVGYTSYREAQKPDGHVLRATAHAATFHTAASLVGPAILIHQTVHAAQAVAKRSGRFIRWGPTLTGLALIPALPLLLDEPAEHAIGWAFDRFWPVPGGGHGGHGGGGQAAGGAEETMAQIAIRGGARSTAYKF
jgi:fission process protein 1